MSLTTDTSAAPRLRPVAERERPFTRTNILMMCACVVLIVVGFLLMSGPGSSPETGFNPDIFSTRRIVVGPTIAFSGFLLMAFAIIWKPKSAGGTAGQADETKDTQSNGMD